VIGGGIHGTTGCFGLEQKRTGLKQGSGTNNSHCMMKDSAEAVQKGLRQQGAKGNPARSAHEGKIPEEGGATRCRSLRLGGQIRGDCASLERGLKGL